MFSAKNYGLPKDLIEAAKRVHEKQLEEKQVPIVKAPEEPSKVRPSEASPETIRAANENEDRVRKKQKRKHPTYIPSSDTKSEEVQFTEEELAEAFAIFLEENFHVEMLTEEDLDYVFENEFPQWLEEAKTADELKAELQRKRDQAKAARDKALEAKNKRVKEDRKKVEAGIRKLERRAASTAGTPASTAGTPASTAGNQVRAKPPAKPAETNVVTTTDILNSISQRTKNPEPKSTAGNQVRAKPASTARRGSGAPKGSFTAYRKRLGLGGDLKSAQSERYKKAYRTYRAAKSPRKPTGRPSWATAAFNRDD